MGELMECPFNGDGHYASIYRPSLMGRNDGRPKLEHCIQCKSSYFIYLYTDGVWYLKQ